MRVVFGVYGHTVETEPLQPWLTVKEVSVWLISQGWDVHVVTDVKDAETLVEGLNIHSVRSLRQTNAEEMVPLIRKINPDCMVLLSTPLNLLGKGWLHDIDCRLYAFLSYPFYTNKEILRALRHIKFSDVVTFGRHSLVPKWVWGKVLRKYFTGLIAQSEKTVSRVGKVAGPGLEEYKIKAGIDLGFWKPADNIKNNDKKTIKFLYVGSAKSIRGFDILLSAFRKLDKCDHELHILARGSNQEEEEKLKDRIISMSGEKSAQITLKGGWIDRERLRLEIQSADVVVLPFVLVPSELPVSVIECVACGTPVIATNINGLPEAVGSAGLIVKSGSVSGLVTAMREVAEDRLLLNKLTNQCNIEREKMLSWDAVGKEWAQVLSE